MRRTRFVLAALLAVFALTACNTVKGFGRDVSKAGDQLEEAVDEARN